jgi:hypothetical protein
VIELSPWNHRWVLAFSRRSDQWELGRAFTWQNPSINREREYARIEADHIGPMLLGGPDDVTRDALAMHYHDAFADVDAGEPYRGLWQHSPQREHDDA